MKLEKLLKLGINSQSNNQMNLDLWSIGIIVIGIQGFFLLVTMIVSDNIRQRRGTTFLMAIIILLLWFLIEFFAIRNKLDLGLNVLYGTRYGSWFLLGPLIYFYFKSITDSGWSLKKRELLHFLPFLIFVIIIPYLSYKQLNDRQIDYGMLSVFDHREKVLTGFQWMYSVVFVLQFIHLGLFLLRNLKTVSRYSIRLKTEFSEIGDQTKWLKLFNVLMLVILIFTGIFLYLLLITDVYRRHLDYIYVLPIGILFYAISFKFIRTDWKRVAINGKYSGSSLTNARVTSYADKVDTLFTVQSIHLKPGLRLEEVAKELDLPKHHVSQVINQHFEMSFFDFVNKFRIEEAKTLITEHPEFTLLRIAFDSGFNNKTSFVNAFKKFEGRTPSQFRELVIY